MWNASVAEPSLTPPPALSPAASASAAHSVVAALNLVEFEVLPAHKVQRPLDQPEPNDALQEGGRASREGTVVRPLPLLLPPARPAAAGKAGGLVAYAWVTQQSAKVRRRAAPKLPRYRAARSAARPRASP